MNKEEFREQFYKNIEYTQRMVPPDDIYMFSEQTFMAAVYFLKRWSECINLSEETEKDEIAKKWATNILAFKYCRENNIDIELNLDLESIEDDD